MGESGRLEEMETDVKDRVSWEETEHCTMYRQKLSRVKTFMNFSAFCEGFFAQIFHVVGPSPQSLLSIRESFLCENIANSRKFSPEKSFQLYDTCYFWRTVVGS